jgi:hypothetical protein
VIAVEDCSPGVGLVIVLDYESTDVFGEMKRSPYAWGLFAREDTVATREAVFLQRRK